MTQSDRLELMGAAGSPYTRKMIALLRYRRIPHNVIWGGHQSPPDGYPAPKVKLLPTFYFQNEQGEIEAVVDSTPIIRRLETDYQGRSVFPTDPELAFYNEILEDYADEWLTKAMFHYRWFFEADRKNAGPLLMYWSANTAPEDQARQMADYFTDRQFNRLYVVGSNDVTARTIEESFERFVDILDRLIQKRGFVLGARPSSADFAIYGQMTQLAIVEPTSAAIVNRRSPRVRAWIDLMEDQSGRRDTDEDWFSPEEARTALAEILAEVGRVYVPFLVANAQAALAGEAQVETRIDGREWTQPVFPYQVKCLSALREAFKALPDSIKPVVRETLHSAQCEALMDVNDQTV